MIGERLLFWVNLSYLSWVLAVLAFAYFEANHLLYHLGTWIWVGGIVCFLASAIGSIRKSRSLETVVHGWQNPHLPQLSERVHSALELGAKIGPMVPDAQTKLIEHHLQTVFREMTRPETRFVPNPMINRPILVLISLSVLTLGLTLSSDRFQSSTLAPKVESPTSWISGLSVEIRPPDYTKGDVIKLENTDGSIRALQGSHVRINGNVTPPEGFEPWLTLPNGETQPLDAANGTIDATFKAVNSGAWHIEMRQGAELIIPEKTKRTLTVTQDKVPDVQLTKPTQDMIVAKDALLQFVYQASDDFGLKETRLVVALDGDLEQAERVSLGASTRKLIRNAEDVDLSLFDIQGGDRVAVLIEAVDNHTPTAQVGRSKAVYLTIESEEENHQALTLKLKDLLEPLLINLADRLEFGSDQTTAPDLEKIHTHGQVTLRELDETISKLGSDPLMPKSIQAKLEESLSVLKLGYRKEAMGLTSKSKVQKHESFEEIIEGTEALIITIESTVARLSLEDMKALTEQIKIRRERLRELLESYKQNPNEALKNRIMRNVKRLKQKMEELRKKMAQLRQKLPEEFLNLEGLKGSELSETMEEGEEKLDDLEKMLDEGRIDDALSALEQLSDSLEALDKLVDNDMETLQREGDPERQRAISELMDQTRDIMKKQEALLKETKSAADAGRSAFEKTLFGEDNQLDKLATELVDAERKISELRETSVGSRRQKKLEALAQSTGETLNALERKDPASALEKLKEAVESSRYLTWDRQSKDHKKDKEINQQLRKAQKDLESMLEMAKQAQQKALQQNESDALSSEQTSLREQLSQLGQQMKAAGEKMPGLDGEAGPSMDEANAAMSKAEQSLGQSQPGQATPSQREALNSLEKTLKNLRQASKPKPAQRNGHRQSREEKVEIPSEQDFTAPKAFREELLEAMKRKTDASNQDAVKRYYKSLVE